MAVELREDIYGGGPRNNLLRQWLGTSITREMAEYSLTHPQVAPPGSFIVRRSTTSPGNYAITVVEANKTVTSYKVVDLGLGQVGLKNGKAFASMEHLLEHFYDEPFPERKHPHVKLSYMHPTLLEPQAEAPRASAAGPRASASPAMSHRGQAGQQGTLGGRSAPATGQRGTAQSSHPLGIAENYSGGPPLPGGHPSGRAPVEYETEYGEHPLPSSSSPDRAIDYGSEYGEHPLPSSSGRAPVTYGGGSDYGERPPLPGGHPSGRTVAYGSGSDYGERPPLPGGHPSAGRGPPLPGNHPSLSKDDTLKMKGMLINASYLDEPAAGHNDAEYELQGPRVLNQQAYTEHDFTAADGVLANDRFAEQRSVIKRAQIVTQQDDDAPPLPGPRGAQSSRRPPPPLPQEY